MPKLQLKVSDSDLADLRASGLTDASIRMAKVRTVGGALEYPFFELSGEANCYKVLRWHKPPVREGKVVKYEQPAGVPARAYIPPSAGKQIRSEKPDEPCPIIITEGMKKALAAVQAGYCCIGLVGVWNWKVNGSDRLMPDLAAIDWHGRTVYICFDWDPKPSTRLNVAQARRRLTQALRNAGATDVRVIALPPGAKGDKVGLDDYLVQQGAEAFSALVHEADEANRVIKIISLPLPQAAYHGPAGKFLRDIGPLTEAPDAAVLPHLLAAVGMLLGPKVHVWAGGPQPARLNFAVVGRTNDGRKGTAFVPVNMLMQRVDPEFWSAQRVSGLSSGEGLIVKLADQWEVDKDGNKKLVATEKRLCVVEPEFARVLANIRREGNILSHVMREAFDSGNLSTLTVNPRHATGAHVLIVTHITPEELRLRLNHIEMANGFGNRFLWWVSSSSKLLPETEPFPEATFLELEKLLRTLKLRADTTTEPRQVPLDEEAKALWREVYPILRADRDGLAGAMTARGASQVLRLALIYCALDMPTKPNWIVNRVHLEAALAVWEYCEESAFMLFGNQTGDDLADKLLTLLKDGPLTRTDFNRHLSPSQKSEANDTLRRLEQAGRVKCAALKHKGAGRPTSVWELVPQQ